MRPRPGNKRLCSLLTIIVGYIEPDDPVDKASVSLTDARRQGSSTAHLSRCDKRILVQMYLAAPLSVTCVESKWFISFVFSVTLLTAAAIEAGVRMEVFCPIRG